MFFIPEHGWALEQAPQESGDSTKHDRVQRALGQCSQAHSLTLGVSCTWSQAGLDDPDDCLPSAYSMILHFLFLYIIFTVLPIFPPIFSFLVIKSSLLILQNLNFDYVFYCYYLQREISDYSLKL